MNYDYLVLYSSRTGNTKKLATALFLHLPGKKKDLQSIEEFRNEETAGVLFVGFWTDHGSCSIEMMDFLSSLHGRKIVLFGTCGMGNSPLYYRDIIDKVSAWLPKDNEILGSFMCQGKMPISVRERYEALYESTEGTNTILSDVTGPINPKKMIARLLHYYDEALLHPSEEDYISFCQFADKILSSLCIFENT